MYVYRIVEILFLESKSEEERFVCTRPLGRLPVKHGIVIYPDGSIKQHSEGQFRACFAPSEFGSVLIAIRSNIKSRIMKRVTALCSDYSVRILRRACL